jgi:hypothetical protein
VWNTESGAEYSLNGPVGQVNALTADKDLLFAGVEVNYFANSLEFFCSLTIVKAIFFYLFKEKKIHVDAWGLTRFWCSVFYAFCIQYLDQSLFNIVFVFMHFTPFFCTTFILSWPEINLLLLLVTRRCYFSMERH